VGLGEKTFPPLSMRTIICNDETVAWSRNFHLTRTRSFSSNDDRDNFSREQGLK
jgi:hypothetical protein